MVSDKRRQHPCFLQPDNPQSLVWRYMDLPKFVSLLNTSSLHYCLLSRLEDPLEGTLPKITTEKLAECSPGALTPRGIVPGMTLLARLTYVNCWTQQETESMALWKIYGRDDLGIAVVTTYDCLAQAIPENHLIGLVQYIRRDSQGVDPNNMYNLIMHKGMQYRYEDEVRIVADLSDSDVGHPSDPPKPVISFPIVLQRLVQRIVVSPFSPDWYFEVVQATVKKFGYDFPVQRSSALTC